MKVEVEDYELANMREYIRRSQQMLGLCTGINQAILELCNVNAGKLDNLHWSLDQLQSQSGTWSVALSQMQERKESTGSTDSNIEANPSPIPLPGTPEKSPNGKRRRRGRPRAKKSRPSTQAAATAVPTKAKSRRRSSLAAAKRKTTRRERKGHKDSRLNLSLKDMKLAG